MEVDTYKWQSIWPDIRNCNKNGDIYIMITYTTKEDNGVTLAVFTSNDINFEVPISGVEEENIQQHLQTTIDDTLEIIERGY